MTTSASRTHAILIVDDDPTVRHVLCRGAATLFAKVVAAANGMEALDKFERGHFDVLVTDVKMPGMSGLDLVRAVRERNSTVRVVVVSGYLEPHDHARLVELNVGVLKKPFGIAEFRELLTRTVAH